MNKWIKKERKRLIELHGGKCSVSICGSTSNLEFAHVQPTGLKGEGRGRKERVYDIRDNPDSYILLCSGCHKALDEGDL